VAWVAVWLFGSSVARRLVIAEAEKRLAARVEIGSLRILPPLWVEVKDLVVASELYGERVEWLRVGAARVRVASLPPFADLRLAAVEADDPVLTLVRTPQGLRDVLDLWRGEDTEETADPPVDVVRAAGARLVVLDRTGATPPRAPASLGGFSLVLDATSTPGSFALSLAGGDRQLSAQGEGTLDLRARTLTLARLDAQASLDSPGATDGAAGPLAALRGMVLAADLARRTVRVDGGSVALGSAPLLLEDVRVRLALGDEKIDGTDLAVRVGGGKASGTFQLRFDEQPGWSAAGDAANVDLAQVAELFPALGGGKVAGRLTGSGSFSGALTADVGEQLVSLRGSGRMKVREGEFYRLPLVAKLLEQANLSSEGVTLSNAAADFRIERRTIHLDETAIGSSSIGVQGHGDVGFDGTLALDMIVVPLGDWRSQMERAGVPVVGEALAKLAGAAQSLFGKASAAIYEFHVSGTMDDPYLTPVPVPVLTRGAATVFGRMADGLWDDVLGDAKR